MIHAEFVDSERQRLAIIDIAMVPRIGEMIRFEGITEAYEVVDVEWQVGAFKGPLHASAIQVRLLCGHYLGSHHKR